MNYTKFYTPPEVASFLIQMLNVPSPNKVIDICCGSCNLLYAAGARWKKVELIGVDIAPQRSCGVHFKQMDGRKYAIQNSEYYSLVLANPPFDQVEVKREFPDLYQGVFKEYRTSRLENEMFLANLLLLRENGTLLIIMPSSFVEAESNRDFRKMIGQSFHVKSIIKLPEDTFGSTLINSYALEIKCKSGQHCHSKLFSAFKADGKFNLSSGVIIPQKNIREGVWKPEKQQKTNVKWDIRRGNISSQFFSDSGVPVLHTAKTSSKWAPSIRYVKDVVISPIYAESGDIIVSRIGKSAGQWCRYIGARIPISDCLYRIKDPEGRIANTLSGREYNFSLKGVATRYITIADFESWYKSII